MKAKIEQDEQELAYKIYMTDSLKGIVGMKSRWIDLIDKKPVDNRTGDEIAIDVIQKAGLIVGGE